MNELTQRGIAALKAGDRAAARKLFASALQQNTQDTTAWLYLSASVDTEGQQIDCLRQVLRIEPGNEVAAKRLAVLLDKAKPADQSQAAAGTPVSGTQAQPAELEEPEGAGAEQAPEAYETYEDRLANIAVQTVEEPQPLTAPQEEQPAALQSTESPAASPPLHAADYLARKQEIEAAVETPAEEIHEKSPAIFKARPSQVPALIGFWVFFFGAVIVGAQLGPLNYLGLAIAVGLWLILEIVVVYVIIRNFRTQYELTEQSLNLRSQSLARRLKVSLPRGEWLRIPITDIVHLEPHQSRFQRLTGTGDILLDAAVNGVLTHLRLRSIPELEKRVKQFKSLMEEQDHVAV